MKWLQRWITGLGLVWGLTPQSARACAACYGASDSEMAAGFNWGIITLLAVILTVLGGFVAFFVYLAKRSHSQAAQPEFPSAMREMAERS